MRSWVVSQNSVDGSQKRILFTSANVFEIIEIECPEKVFVKKCDFFFLKKRNSPDHGTTKSERLHVFTLVANHRRVIEGHPLISRVGVRSHSTLEVSDNAPVLLSDVCANLKKKILGSKILKC